MEKIYINATKVNTQYIETMYTLEEVANPQTEDYDINVNYTHGFNENGLLSIQTLKAVIQKIDDEINSGDITHVDIDFNCDHSEYEFGKH